MSEPEEVEAALLQFEREEVETFLAQDHDVGKSGASYDTVVASRLYLEAIEERSAVLRDHQIAKSINNASDADCQLLTEAQQAEQRLLGNGDLAQKLSGVSQEVPTDPCSALQPYSESSNKRQRSESPLWESCYTSPGPEHAMDGERVAAKTDEDQHQTKRQKISDPEQDKTRSEIQRECLGCTASEYERDLMDVGCAHSYC